MYENNQPFRPEQVDEQIDQLSPPLLLPDQEGTPEQQLVRELEEMYGNGQEVTQAVEHVWQRLEQSHRHLMTHQLSEQPPFLSWHKPSLTSERIRPMPSRKRRALAFIAVIAATILLATLFGSLAIIKHTNPQPTAHKAPAPSYLYATVDQTFYKMNAQTGQVIWKQAIVANTPISTPVSLNNTVYIIVWPNHLEAFNASNGAWKWSTDIETADQPELATAHLIVVGQRLYYIRAYLQRTSAYAYNNYSTCMVNPSNGQLLKCYPLLPTVIQDDIIYGFITTPRESLTNPGTNDGIYAFDTDSNKMLWQESITPPVTNSARASLGDLLFESVGTLYATYSVETSSHPAQNLNYIYAFSAQTGKGIWRQAVQQNIGPGFLVGNGKVYYDTEDPGYNYTIYALDAASGKALWSRTGPDDLYLMYDASPGLSGAIYVFDVYVGGGYLFALNTKTGAPIWKSPPIFFSTSQHPIVDPGKMIYAVTIDNYIGAVNVSNGSVAWKWKAPFPGASITLSSSAIADPLLLN